MAPACGEPRGLHRNAGSHGLFDILARDADFAPTAALEALSRWRAMRMSGGGRRESTERSGYRTGAQSAGRRRSTHTARWSEADSSGASGSPAAGQNTPLPRSAKRRAGIA